MYVSQEEVCLYLVPERSLWKEHMEGRGTIIVLHSYNEAYKILMTREVSSCHDHSPWILW